MMPASAPASPPLAVARAATTRPSTRSSGKGKAKKHLAVAEEGTADAPISVPTKKARSFAQTPKVKETTRQNIEIPHVLAILAVKSKSDTSAVDTSPAAAASTDVLQYLARFQPPSSFVPAIQAPAPSAEVLLREENERLKHKHAEARAACPTSTSFNSSQTFANEYLPGVIRELTAKSFLAVQPDKGLGSYALPRIDRLAAHHMFRHLAMLEGKSCSPTYFLLHQR